MCPNPIAKIPIYTLNIKFNKNNLYKPWLIKLCKWKDHPLNVVIEPQRPTPKTSLYLFEIADELTNPNKKEPNIFTKKISSIINLTKAPGIAPIEIKKNVFFLISINIYLIKNKNPNAKAMMPSNIEIKNNLNALENLNCKHKLNKLYINEEKELRLPKKPIEKNNISW